MKNHIPEAVTTTWDEPYLTCSCGWEQGFEKKSIGWLDHLPDSLDAAWAEAAAALPEGLWSIEVVKTVGALSGPYMAGTTFGPPARGYAYADTPAAALRALTAKLREVPR